MKRYLPFIIIAAVACVTVAGGAVFYRAKKAELSVGLSDATSAGQPGGMAPHSRGNVKAPVTIEEFGDFQCPPCGQLSEPLNQLERDFTKRVRLIFRHYPLANHVHAKSSAFAAEAAGLQGKFWEMHDLLYREQATWSKAEKTDELFVGYAKTIGLDLGRFQRDRAGEEVKTRVAADEKRAADLGVSVTPTVFLNSKSVPNTSLDPAKLRTAVEAALAEATASAK